MLCYTDSGQRALSYCLAPYPMPRHGVGGEDGTDKASRGARR